MWNAQGSNAWGSRQYSQNTFGPLSNAPVEFVGNGHGISESLPGVPEDLSGPRLKDTEERSNMDIFVEIVLLVWGQSALLRFSESKRTRS